MAQFTNEMIWHFAGYLHLQDLLNLSSVRYTGAPNYETTGYHGESYDTPSEFEVDWPTAARGLRVNLNGAQARGDDGSSPPILTTHSPGNSASIPSIFEVGHFFPFRPAPPNGQPGPFPFEPLTVTAEYTFGESQYHDLYGKQSNHIIDDDVIFGGEAFLEGADVGVGAGHGLDVEGRLSDLIDVAESHVPIDVLQSFEHPGDVFRVDIDSDDIILPDLKGGGEDAPVIQAELNGHYVNGALSDGPGDEMEAQFDQIDAAISLVADKDPDNTAERENEAASDAGPSLSEVLNFPPSADLMHTADMGNNEAVNAAFMFDFSEAQTSRVIRGDYHETNAIIQVNVLHDVDDIELRGTGLVEQLASGNNTLHNEATLVNDIGTLYGDASRGVPGAIDWQVDYVYGNFYDVSTQVQRNYLFDNDFNYESSKSGQYSVTTGDDGQLNISQLVELGSGYDLIIIAGSYYKLNAIVQTNVILDDDLVYQIARDGAQASRWVDTGGNSITNDAAIYNIGGAKFDPLSESAKKLAETIGDQKKEFDYELAIGLPGDGDDTFEVLYVTGDYYNYNLLFQTNVVTDVDELHQVPEADSGNLKQSAESGGNTLVNAAAIVDYDSQSDYQFVDGEVLEESILVQANIISDDAPLDDEKGIHDDVVATVAALSGQDEPDRNEDDYDNGTLSGTAEVDLIGGILA